jgi:hypothetical protein
MLSLGIALLWFLLGAIIVAAIIYFGLAALRRFVPALDANVEYAIWVCYVILCLIYILMAISGDAPFAFGHYRG